MYLSVKAIIVTKIPSILFFLNSEANMFLITPFWFSSQVRYSSNCLRSSFFRPAFLTRIESAVVCGLGFPSGKVFNLNFISFLITMYLGFHVLAIFDQEGVRYPSGTSLKVKVCQPLAPQALVFLP